MKRIIILIGMIFLLSGCSATYDLYIGEKLTDEIFLNEDNSILENLKSYNMNDDTAINFENYSFQVDEFQSDFDYVRDKYSNDSVSGYVYNYTYNFDNTSEKSMVYNCYDEIKTEKDSDNIVIETSNEFKCFNTYSLLDNVTVNIHYSGKLVDTNADSINNNVYTWNINKDNYENKKIYFKGERVKKNYTFEIVASIIFLFLVFISLIVIFKYKNRQQQKNQ